MELDFSKSEALIYLVLLQHEDLSASEISQKTRIPRTKVYEILRSMLLKKFLVEVPAAKKCVAAVKPETLFNSIKIQIDKELSEKKKAAAELNSEITEFTEEKTKAKTKVSYEVFEIVKEPELFRLYLSENIKEISGKTDICLSGKNSIGITDFQDLMTSILHGKLNRVILHSKLLEEEVIMEINRKKYINNVEFRIIDQADYDIYLLEDKISFMNTKSSEGFLSYVFHLQDFNRILLNDFNFKWANSIEFNKFTETL